MNRIQNYFFTIALTIFSPLVVSEEAYIAPLVAESLLLDLTQANDQLYAVGERGHILRSTDGNSWNQEEVPTLSTITAIDAVGDKLWAVGHDALILHKAAVDAEWQIQMFEPDLEKPFLDVVFLDENQGIAVGAYGSFYRTTDGGKNWSKELHAELLHPDDVLYLEEIRLEDEAFYLEELGSILPHFNRISQQDGILYLAGETGLIAKSDNQGKSWERMEVNYNGSFFDISALPNGTIVAAGLRGNLFKYRSSENGWERVNSGVEASLNSVIALDGENYLVVGNGAALVCHHEGQVSNSHVDDGKAILNAKLVNGDILAVTAGGIQRLAYAAQKNICEGNVVAYE